MRPIAYKPHHMSPAREGHVVRFFVAASIKRYD